MFRTYMFLHVAARVPPGVLDEATRRFEQIAAAISRVAAGPSSAGGLLDVHDWRFQYRIDRRLRRLIVELAVRLPEWTPRPTLP